MINTRLNGYEFPKFFFLVGQGNILSLPERANVLPFFLVYISYTNSVEIRSNRYSTIETAIRNYKLIVAQVILDCLKPIDYLNEISPKRLNPLSNSWASNIKVGDRNDSWSTRFDEICRSCHELTMLFSTTDHLMKLIVFRILSVSLSWRTDLPSLFIVQLSIVLIIMFSGVRFWVYLEEP